MNGNPDIAVIMPALDEELHVRDAVRSTLLAFDEFGLNGEIIVINDGSTDRTEEIVRAEMGMDDRVRMIKHETPHGIGASFWDGVDHSSADSVVMLPGDNENDPLEILRYSRLLEHVDIVIPFVFNKEVRSLFRNGLSYLYRFIINTTFLVHFNYTNGTILYRRSILKELDYRSRGFFFQTDILVRSVKQGYLFAEVPYRLGVRESGVSRATTFPSLLQVMRGYMRLVRDYYFKTKGARKTDYVKGSQTARRYVDRNGKDGAREKD